MRQSWNPDSEASETLDHLFYVPHPSGPTCWRRRWTHTHTHQTLVSEGVVDAPDEQPEGPQVLKPELEHKVRQQHQSPHHQELQVEEGTGRSRDTEL